MLFFSIYFFNADKIIYSIKHQDFRVTKISKEFTPDFTSLTGWYAFDTFNYRGSLEETLEIIGWSFFEVEQENDERYVEILFVGESNYSIEAALQSRFDVKDSFNGNLHSNNLGFSATFSTITIKNGEYDIYLYVKENETTEGYIKTNKRIVKDYNGIREYVPPEPTEVAKPSELEEYEGISFFIDSKKISSSGEVSVSGWAFMEEIETENQNIYLLFTQQDGSQFMYETNSVTRNDVGTHFDNPLYNYSGFSLSTTLNPDEYVLEGLSFQVVIEDNGTYYLSEIRYDFNEIEVEKVSDPEEILSNMQIDFPEEYIGTEDISYNIDNITISDNISIRGWTYLSQKETADQRVQLLFTAEDGTQVMYETTQQSRPDVGTHFENELYYEAGFSAIIDVATSDFEFQDSSMQIVIEIDGEFFLKPSTIPVENKN